MALGLLALLVSCGSGRLEDNWRIAVAKEVTRSGDRNWIVIADAAFPVVGGRERDTLIADAESPEVLGEALEAMSIYEHVRPRIYMSDEISFVSNDIAPGADEYRRAIERTLRGRPVVHLRQRLLDILLEDARVAQRVLVVKTHTALPYSAVYMELANGYWDQHAEQELRERMDAAARARQKQKLQELPSRD